MTNEQIDEAIDAAIALCDRRQERYIMTSMRSALVSLGYDEQAQQQVIEDVASRGFSYCLDHTVSHRDRDGETFFPSREVCFWGPDQLRSRLECLSSR